MRLDRLVERRLVALEASARRVIELEALADRERVERDRLIGEAIRAGLPARVISERAGVTRARVYQIRDNLGL